MKNTIYGLVLVGVVLCLGLPVTGEPTTPTRPAKIDAPHIFGRTAAIISNAQRLATQGQKSEGLGLAVSHQLLAQELYKSEFYRQAIFHSFRARILATQVITQKKNTLLREALFDRIEEKYTPNMPLDQELDQKLKASKIQILSDQAAAHVQLPLNIE